MIKRKIGQRKGQPFHFDMRKGFRMGDLAGAHVYLTDWRTRNTGRLVIVWNRHAGCNAYSQHFPMSWVFGDVADEIWESERPNDSLALPPGHDLSVYHIWDNWFHLRQKQKLARSLKISPLPAWTDQAHAALRHFGITERFVTVQPLFDAPYNTYRNAPVEWWDRLIRILAPKVPTVVLASSEHRDVLPICSRAYPAWDCSMDPLGSLGLISLAGTHVGGETGLPLWAGIFKVPVVFASRKWGPYKDKRATYDFRPIDFGAPVVHAQLEGDPEEVAARIINTFEGREKSTPDVGPLPFPPR